MNTYDSKKDRSWCRILTDDAINISINDSVRKLTIKNTTAVLGYYTSTAGIEIDSQASQPMPISENESLTITPAKSDGILADILIEAPAGCTLKVICQM